LGFKPTHRVFPSFDRTQDSDLIAAFVAVTVAGQQGNSLSTTTPPIPILDFGLLMLRLRSAQVLDWIENPKSKI